MAEDECAFYLNEAPRRAWGWKGERVISWRPGNIIEHYTLLLCIRNRAIILHIVMILSIS